MSILVLFSIVFLFYTFLAFSAKSSSILGILFFIVFFISIFSNSSVLGLLPHSFVAFIKYIDEAYVCFAFFYFLFFNLKKTDVLFLLLITIYFLSGFISGIKNDASLNVIFQGGLLSLKGPMLFFVGKHLLIKDDIYKKINTYCIWFFWLTICLSIVDFLLGDIYKDFFHIYSDSRFDIIAVSGFFAHPSDNASCLLICIILFITFYRKHHIKFLLFIGTFLLMTFRVKEIVSFFILTPIFSEKNIKKKIIIIVIIIFAMSGIYKHIMPKHFNAYFGDVYNTQYARNALTITSAVIAKENFPFGEGFGRFGGHISAKFYSLVYEKYSISNVFGLSEEFNSFIADTFWPMILGESGLLGLLLYLLILFYVFLPFFNKQKCLDKNSIAIRNVFLMFLIISIAAPIFVRPPYYFIFGFAALVQKRREECENNSEKE